MAAIEISFRKESRGGGFRQRPVATETAFAPHNRLILLVHGYNVSQQEAEDSYQRFREQVVKKNAPILAKQLGEVYWPSDHKNKLVSTLTFARRIPVAIQTGFSLGKFLLSRKSFTDRPVELVLIGHSLGCRVILETLANLANREPKGHRRVRIFLMAAGVPVQMVEPNGRLRNAVTFATESYTFCSIGDEALFIFPIGQKMVGEENLSKFDPVGTRGEPDGVWTERHRDDSFLHGDYWTKPAAVESILRALGEPSPKSIAERNPLTVRETPKRQMKLRLLVRSRKPRNRSLWR